MLNTAIMVQSLIQLGSNTDSTVRTITIIFSDCYVVKLYHRIRSGTEINISDPDPDLNPNSDPKLDPKKICKKNPYFQAEIRWFHMIIYISHLQVVATIAVQ